MNKLYFDIEGRSVVDLRRVGPWRYASHPDTQVTFVGYAINAEPVRIWRASAGAPVPEVFHEATRDPSWRKLSHNVQFDRTVEQLTLGPRVGWPLAPLERYRCTMARALAAALPGALEKVAAALDLPLQKDMAGAKLMKQLARPRQFDTDGKPIWIEDEERLERLQQYLIRDVELVRILDARLPPLSDAEQELWELDATINARGFYIAIELAKVARELSQYERAAIDAEISTLTGGKITSAGQVARITAYVRERGHQLAGLTKRSVSAVLAHEPEADVRQLLELRREGSRASVYKLDTLLAAVDDDRRLRGTLRYHGGAPGRWSGRGFQPQNLKRPEGEDITDAVEAVLTGDLDTVRTLGAPLDVIGDTMRSMICAAPGHRLIAGDFSSVEARVLSWYAGETWKLDTFRQYDVTQDSALDVYLIAAARVLRRSVTPDDEAGRQTGKTCELAFGFGGALGAWRKFDPDQHSDQEVKGYVQRWRQAHPATIRFWRRLESAIKVAIRTGKRGTLGRLAFEFEDGTLRIVLPNSRRIHYPQARLGPGKFAGTTQVTFKDNARGGWVDTRAWYGVFVENVVQATARDLLATAMQRLERAGYPVILTVHDEIVCEIAEGFGSTDEFHQLMIEPPSWAENLPIAAKVRTGQRYSKQAKPAGAPVPEAATAAPEIDPESELARNCVDDF
jgi:DNA polymerase